MRNNLPFKKCEPNSRNKIKSIKVVFKYTLRKKDIETVRIEIGYECGKEIGWFEVIYKGYENNNLCIQSVRDGMDHVKCRLKNRRNSDDKKLETLIYYYYILQILQICMHT